MQPPVASTASGERGPALEESGAGTISARGLTLTYGKTSALRGADFDVAPGEVLALVGPSGSGKSSLLLCLAGVLQPDAGSITLDGRPFSALNADERAAVRLRRFGLVLQFGELVPELSLRENVMLPLLLTGTSRRDARPSADELMQRLGILEEADRRPGQVSGGQAQRAAVARAVIHRPGVVYADEPTGALDRVASESVLEELFALVRQQRTTLVLVTHDDRVALRADRQLQLIDGRCVVGS